MNSAFDVLSDVVLAITAERSAEPVLQRLVRAARALTGAQYAAIGVPDGHGGFARFLTEGMDAETIDAIGWLPRTHGLLGAMLSERHAYRTADIRTDPRYVGWPPAHPDMRSFLGVPIVRDDETLGAIYLTDKVGAPVFTDDDQRIIELLAAHAAVAIDNARLWERSREASMLEERANIARELHDAMTQTLFSLGLTAETAAAAISDDPAAALAHIRAVQELARSVQKELRSLIVELRPADLDVDGLVVTLRKHLDLLRRAHDVEIALDAGDQDLQLGVDVERELFRIVQEAVHNALRHADATRIRVGVDARNGAVRISVRDDGVGFDPGDARLRARRLGLASMRHRARDIGAAWNIESSPGAGTVVTVELG